MALTAENEQRLKDAGLIKFLDEHRPAFRRLAAAAFAYTKGYVQPVGQPVRVDDVAAALELSLRVSKELEQFLATHRLTQKYWVRFFADLILDRLWPELTAPPARRRASS